MIDDQTDLTLATKRKYFNELNESSKGGNVAIHFTQQYPIDPLRRNWNDRAEGALLVAVEKQ